MPGVLPPSCEFRSERLAQAFVAVALAVSSLCYGQRPDEVTNNAYFQGLRERGLFRLAEAYCNRRLAQDDLPEPLQTTLTVELIATLTQHGAAVVGTEQAELWHEAHQVVARYVERFPRHAGRLIVEAHGSLVTSSAGRWQRWESQLRPEDAQLARAAVRDLQNAVSQLATIEQRLGLLISRDAAVLIEDREPPVVDLRMLMRRLRTIRGEVWLDLAELAPEGSEQRSLAAAEAKKLFGSPGDANDDELTWQSRIGLAVARRLVGDTAQALSELEALEKRLPSRNISDRLLAEKLRVHLAAQRFREVQALLEDRRRLPMPLSGELLFLTVEIAARQLWHEADAKSTAALAHQLRRLEELAVGVRHDAGGIWAYRADLVVAKVRETQQYGPELAALVRQAQAEYQHGGLAEASALYGKASGISQREGQDELAFRFGFMSASIDMQSKKFEAAAAKLFELVAAHPRNSQAAEAHLLAAYALGRLYDEQQTLHRREDFSRALEDHRTRFADPKTTGEATWLLGELNERRGQLTTALSLYREIPWEHARSSPALAAAARCYEKMLERLRRADEPTTEWERAAIDALQETLPSAASPMDGMNVHQVEAAVRFSRILLSCQPPRFAVADRWLLRALASAGPPPNTPDPARDDPVGVWRATALQLRIISLAGQGEYPQARQQLEQVGATRPAELLRILEGLAPLTADHGRDPLNDLGSLRLEAALRLGDQRAALSAAERRRLDECLAQAYVSTGDTRRGIEIYEALLKEHPRDARLLDDYARLRSMKVDGPSLTAAAAAWKRLETLHAPGSDAWLAARFELCRCLQKLGNLAEACKLLKVTRLLYPNLGGAERERQFVELESHCGNAAP